MTDFEANKINEVEKRLKVVLHVMGEVGVDQDLSDGCVWVLYDILQIFEDIKIEICKNQVKKSAKFEREVKKLLASPQAQNPDEFDSEMRKLLASTQPIKTS